ncbi:MAG TPA: serine O-acetyltransferase EpsC [Tepidisphaeraceae bacterium]|jgi:serine O-acetyltransferase|nr:serine O-acetyltransferase EpsC [Tepidisphaeraceae bacterium]
MDRQQLNQRLSQVVESIVESARSLPGLTHLDSVLLPNRDKVIEIVDRLRELVFPGYFGKQGLTKESVQFRLGELTLEIADMLYEQIRRCLRYRKRIPDGVMDEDCRECDQAAAEFTHAFLMRVPQVRELLAADVQAAYDSDPAAKGTDETIFCYPGMFAIFVQRLAHELYTMNVPLLPRIMTEYAHSLTGIDIHPGATLGRSFFIDHGTGVVIGETCSIGNNVKIYQGVTLGALAPDRHVEEFRTRKRHPTIEDDVIIYAGATILGGDTVIGKGALIGGNVFITATVPPFNRVTADPPKLKYRERRQRSGGVKEFAPDFQI